MAQHYNKVPSPGPRRVRGCVLRISPRTTGSVDMLSSRAKYALRAVVFVADQQGDDRWILTADIAEAEAIPRKFLEAILVEMRDSHILESRRGRYGGYRLAAPAAGISAGAVIRVVDGPLALTPCASRTQFAACTDCVDVDVCSLRPLLQRARDAVAAVLDGCSIAELAGARHSNGRLPTELVL